MKILVAGATGAIGQPLIRLLTDQKYDVYGITQSREKAAILEFKGAHAIILNVLDQAAVFSIMEQVRPNIVIDMLTHLPQKYNAESMQNAAEMNAKIRLEGGANLQAAAEIYGVDRFIAQSSAFWYAPGKGLADEHTSFAFESTPGIALGVDTYAKIEKRILQSAKLKGIALRFGFFYGPGTWFYPNGDVAQQICQQQFPIIGDGKGIWNFVHVEDAASAIIASLKGKPGVYNIVNDYPIEMREWLPAFANFLGAPVPRTITEQEGIRFKGSDAVYYATKLRGASNAKAKQALHFIPRPLEWLI